jgi:Rrf2 family protein
MDEVVFHLDISKKYLEKISRRLQKNGIIETVRGPNGGYRLCENNNNINLYSVYIALEDKVEEGICFEKQICRTKLCTTSKILTDINQEIATYMQRKSLISYFKGEQK